MICIYETNYDGHIYGLPLVNKEENLSFPPISCKLGENLATDFYIKHRTSEIEKNIGKKHPPPNSSRPLIIQRKGKMELLV